MRVQQPGGDPHATQTESATGSTELLEGGAGSAQAQGGQVLDALVALPGGRQLLALAERRPDLALVGGAVRDLLLGGLPRELDVVLDADAAALARELAGALGGAAELHERFGTAAVVWRDGRIDLAQRRAERYSAPGALPEVRPGSVGEDLRRRDFTVNAIAVFLGGPHRGELRFAEHALEDLDARRLRVLHEHSFVDDPTRLLRLARYRARLRFDVEPDTARLAAAAVSSGALASVSRARVGAELRLALGEADAPAALEQMDALGLLAALDPRLRFDGRLARRGLELLEVSRAEGDARPDLLVLSVLLVSLARTSQAAVEADMRMLLDELEFAAADRETAIRDALGLHALASDLADAGTRSQVHGAARGFSAQGVALAGALGELDGRPRAGLAAREWLVELRDVTLAITGEDLLAAGIPQGPEIGLRLQAALASKLDGELPAEGPEAELSVALEADV